MPTTSQSLLSRRSGESPLATPRAPGTNPGDQNPISAVKSLTVTFPRVYLDQRHGYSTLRGEHGELFLNTHDVDKIVKKYIRTGDAELHLPMRRFPSQFDPYGQTNTNYKAVHAKEMLPLRRNDTSHGKEEAGANTSGMVDQINEDEFDDAFCRSRPIMTVLDSLTDEELQDHNDDNYVYFEVNVNKDYTGNQRSAIDGANHAEMDDVRNHKMLKLRRVEVLLEDGVMDEVFVDDSDLSQIKVYRIAEDSRLVLVKDIEMDSDESNAGIKIKVTEDQTGRDTDISKYYSFSNKGKDGMSKESRGLYEEGNNSFSQYMTGKLDEEQINSDGSGGMEQLSVKRIHHKKNKSKKSANGHVSPRGYSDLDLLSRGMDLQFPQKPILPAVSTPKSDMKNPTSAKKGRNVAKSNIRSGVPHPGRRHVDRGNEVEDESSLHLTEHTHDDVSLSQTLLPQQGDLGGENSQGASEADGGGLTRMQQLSVEKKLRYLEPPLYFYDKPASRPLSMCFENTGTNITHAQVRIAVKKTLENIPDGKLTSLQFVARNVVLGTMWVDNRWIVGLSTKQCVTVLQGRGIQLIGEQIKLRKYDDVVKDDYEKFLQNKDRFSKKGGKKQMKQTSQSQTNALSLLDSNLPQDALSPIGGITAEPIQVAA